MKFTHGVKHGLELNPKTVPHCLHCTVAPVTALHIGKSRQRISILKCMVGNRSVTFLGVSVSLQKVT